LPAAGKKLRLDDDEEESKTRGGGSMTVVILAGLGALVVALGGLGATGYFLFTNLDTSDSTLNTIGSGTGTKSNPKGGPKGGPIIPKGGGGIIPGTPDFPDPSPGPIVPKPKKVETFDLRPVAGVQQAITPPPFDLTVAREVKLPGQATSVSVGGNGRYIVLHFRDLRQMGIFDASKGTFALGSELVDGHDVKIAAGQNRVAALTDRNILRVYSLPDLKRLYDSTGPQIPHNARWIMMGSATNGPMLAVNPFGESELFDIAESGAKPIEGSRQKVAEGIIPPVRVSANGKLFVLGGFGNSDKTAFFTETGGKWKSTDTPLASAYPSPDGRFVYGFGMIMTERGTMIGGRAGTVDNGVWYVPAVHGSYFLRLTQTKQANKDLVSVSIHRNPLRPEAEKGGDLGVLPETEGFVNSFFKNSLPLDQHLFLIPDAKMLVVLPNSKDKLILRKADVR
jgi:hypothetical protein